ncbi:hypothetical protein E3N88_31140 [Mikania micrantha]|uniref:Uncharacterized protein n=1 Tax=Mikania micrantha TaxID=192012 RepID=A0A5N6MPG4_9ASTR|nr:hypothetical protein E3N88_31140 [Mikania micrantha]
MDDANQWELKPAPEFQEDSRAPVIKPNIADSTEMCLIQWPKDQVLDFDWQQLFDNLVYILPFSFKVNDMFVIYRTGFEICIVNSFDITVTLCSKVYLTHLFFQDGSNVDARTKAMGYDQLTYMQLNIMLRLKIKWVCFQTWLKEEWVRLSALIVGRGVWILIFLVELIDFCVIGLYFDYSVENHLKVMDEIATCSGESEIEYEQAVIQRLSSSVTF